MKEERVDSRFENGTQDAVDVMERVRREWFEHLKEARIKVLFDTKERKKGPMLILGRIMKANDLIRRLTEQFAPGGCDYVLFLDKIAFSNMEEEDRVRLIRHELRHCVYDPFAKTCWKLIPHDIEDFEVEIALNKDNAGWAKRIAAIAAAIYEQQKDDKKQPSVNPAVVVQKEVAPMPIARSRRAA